MPTTVSAPVVLPAWDLGSDDSDRDQPLQEPEFVIHFVDDNRRRRLPVPGGVLPIQHPPPPLPEPDDAREAARIKRLHYCMLFPQTVLCLWTLICGSAMIYLATQPEAERPDHRCIWVIDLTALVMFFALLSAVLSHLGVYVHDRCPGLDDWLHEIN